MMWPALRQIQLVAAVAIVAAGLAAAVHGYGRRYEDPFHRTASLFVTDAVFVDGRLWMLRDDGSLASLAPQDSEPQPVEAGGRTLKICRSAMGLVVVVETDERHWSVKQRKARQWQSLAALESKDEAPVTLACSPVEAAATLVTDRRLIEIDGSRVRPVALSEALPHNAPGTALVDGKTLWVGIAAGEWGGGLRRIDRSTGRVQSIASNRSGGLCGGPLNPKCDPVNGVVASPFDSSCVIAAIGLLHIGPHGRLVEVCGSVVRRIYFKPLDLQRSRELDDGEPSDTGPFYGLVRVGRGMWAVGSDGLHVFDGSETPRVLPFPPLDDRGGYRVSFDLPGLVLVDGRMSWRMRAEPGPAPILVSR